MPAHLLSSLLPFQVEGVKFVLSRQGRALLADEMGLGKTVQALASAQALDGFPLLIVCPATLRLLWAVECEKWIPARAAVGQLHVIFGHGDLLPGDARPSIVIVSYHMLRILLSSMLLLKWEMIIFDESHSITTTCDHSEAGMTLAALRMAKNVEKVLLLSGTPSLTRPFSIYNQINLLRPGLLGSSKLHFAMTYCPQQNTGWERRERRKHGQGWESASVREGACVRPWELNLLLCETVMIRRLKVHVLAQLPLKRRQLVPVTVTWRDVLEAGVRVVPSAGAGKVLLADPAGDGWGGGDGDGEAAGGEMTTYHQVGMCKVRGGIEWLLRVVRSWMTGGRAQEEEDLIPTVRRDDAAGRGAEAAHGEAVSGAAADDDAGEPAATAVAPNGAAEAAREGVACSMENAASRDRCRAPKIVVFGHHRSVLDRIHRALLEAEESRISEELRRPDAVPHQTAVRTREPSQTASIGEEQGAGIGAKGSAQDDEQVGCDVEEELLQGGADAGGGGSGAARRLPGELKVFRIDGATPSRSRVEILERFRACSCAAIIVISVTAGGQGVDLSCASVGVFFEMPPDCGWVRQVDGKMPNCRALT